jgi:hypothetical protein
VLVLVIIALIIAVIIADFLGDRPDRRGANPFEFSVADYEPVDEAWIHYLETGRIDLEDRRPGGFALYGNEIFLTGKDFLQVIRTDGVQRLFEEIGDEGTCIAVNDDFVFVGFNDHVARYSHNGNLVSRFEPLGNRCIITSLALMEDNLYVADAGNRRVLRYDLEGNLLGEFRGESGSDTPHGFIVPSPSFDLVVNGFGELWVVNPGVHAIENYTDDGRLRGYWQSSSMDIEGFSGCCNPAEIAVTGDGSFVTSEKGLVRIKIHDASGKLVSVVAAPEKFRQDGQAPEVAVDGKGVIFALDFDENMIRIFEKKPSV